MVVFILQLLLADRNYPIKCSSLDFNQLTNRNYPITVSWLTVIIPSTILPLLGTRLSKNKSVSTYIVEGRLMTQQNGSFSINDSASPRSLTSQMTHFTSTLRGLGGVFRSIFPKMSF